MAENGNVGTDAALMRRLAKGDQRASRLLVAEHLSRMVGFAYNMLGSEAEAEDVAQEAFVRLCRQAPDWSPEARIGTWLYRVVHNLCIDQLRRRKRYPDVEVPDDPDPAPGQMALHQRKRVRSIVDAAIGELPERQRAAIHLVHHRELGNIEAAEIMDVSVEALESLLSRGRRTLRKLLASQKEDLIGEFE